MFAVKLLERKGVIQFFGFCLTFAPLFNIAIAMWMRQIETQQKWNLASFIAALSSGTLPHYALSILSIAIGIVMLRGSVTAWKYVLFLLGCHILIQLANIGPNIRKSWLWGLFFVVNVSVFIFIADQLVFKLKVPAKKPIANPNTVPEMQSTQTTLIENFASTGTTKHDTESLQTAPIETTTASRHPAVPQTSRRMMIHFEGFGPWAQLISVSNKRLHVRCTTIPPFTFDERSIEVNFRNGLILHTRLARKSDYDFFFEYEPLKNAELDLLSDWVRQRAA